MTRLGMHSSQLSSLEVLRLFYSFYSPTQTKIQPLTEQALQLIHTALVEEETAMRDKLLEPLLAPIKKHQQARIDKQKELNLTFGEQDAIISGVICRVRRACRPLVY